MNGPQAGWLADGRRLHLNHGPIDLIVEAFGDPDQCAAAYQRAIARFETVLTELVGELDALRKPAGNAPRRFEGPIAARMEAAVAAHYPVFITPMAAVAGAVADEMLATLCEGSSLRRAYVNNGGDIALHLAPGEEIRVAIGGLDTVTGDRITIGFGDPVRGIATSGWRGRSHSLGIADAVTVLARSGAVADAAATIIANAVDLPGHKAISRSPAVLLSPDSDLGTREVTTGVGPLSEAEIDEALDKGMEVADDLLRRGLIAGVALNLAGKTRIHSLLWDAKNALKSNGT
ncbi:UPF0280 family protein [Aliihoeflea sp. PC F10.4]